MLVPKWSGYPDLRGRVKEEGLPKGMRRSSQGGRSIWVSRGGRFREGDRDGEPEPPKCSGKPGKTGAECPLGLAVWGAGTLASVVLGSGGDGGRDGRCRGGNET